ncbi:hypothetical protein KSP40_PGU010661 [Platanthera guangdongensis]|uniref:Uncharacterized protein n=1 Tax=Platanthera guangdongensis TaxID=2320717 RepID=A0ABR2N4B6_9ASPA
MACRFLRLKRLTGAPSSLLLLPSRLSPPSLPRYSPKHTLLPKLNSSASCNLWIISRDLSSGSVNLVISDGKPKFEIQERDPPKKHKWKTKKRLKLQRKREKTKRKEANKRDPRCIRPKGQKKKQKFPTAEARIKYKIEKCNEVDIKGVLRIGFKSFAIYHIKCLPNIFPKWVKKLNFFPPPRVA